jgi:hypothetical protein
MRLPGKMDKEEGLLSIDFIVGFTIFMVALIFVAIMISGLLVHLQSRTIDYDAVAYRTSVVLVEDPGEPKDWQLLNLSYYSQRKDLKRLGLSVEKGYPGILKLNKVENFFNYEPSPNCLSHDSLCNPSDYREKIIFGDYPYNFNITLRGLGTTPINYSVGYDTSPNSSYGFIKRIVKIQMPGSTYYITGINESNYSTFIVRYDFPQLYERIPPYQIDPLQEDMQIFINLSDSWPTDLHLIGFEICKYPLIGLPGCIGESTYDNSPKVNITVDGNEASSAPINSNLSILLESGLFPRIGYDKFSSIDVNLTFNQNVTNQSLYFYTYSPELTQPKLEPAVLEVRVW